MDRLFLDANVLFSAAYRPGSPLARLWRLKRVTLLSSPYAIEEARRNLADDAHRSTLLRLVTAIEQIHAIATGDLLVALPLKDQPILRAAMAGHASHLITGDFKHFGKFFGTQLMGILVVPPADYLKSRPD